MTQTNASEKPSNLGFSDGVGAEPGGSGDVDARVLEALRAREGATFSELVEAGVVDEREAKRARDRLMYRGEIELVGHTRVVKARHGCPSCRCDVGGRPRAIYMPVGDAEEPFSSPEGGSP